MKRLVSSALSAIMLALTLAACGGDNIHSAQVVTTANGDTVEIWCDGNTFHSKPVQKSVEYASQDEVREPNSPYCKGNRLANDPTRDSWFDWWLYSSLFRSSPYYGSYAFSPAPQRTIVQVVNNTPARTAAPTVKPTTKPASPTTKPTTKPASQATPTTKATLPAPKATLPPPKATLPAPDPKTRVPDAKAPPAPTSKSSSGSSSKSSSSGSSSGTKSSSGGSSSKSSSSGSSSKSSSGSSSRSSSGSSSHSSSSKSGS